MEKRDQYAARARQIEEKEKEKNRQYAAYRTAMQDVVIDAMPVILEYTAKVGRVESFRRGDEHVFVQTYALTDGRVGEEWDDITQNSYAIRDEFFKVKSYEQALEFLRRTGRFSPLSPRITWNEFQKWQQLARLAQEHNELATAMREKKWDGQCAEVLKALTGNYPSSFFDGCEDPLYLHDRATEYDLDDELRNTAYRAHHASNHEEWLSAYQDEVALLSAIGRREKWKREKEQRRRALVGWFRRPPVSVEWVPNGNEAEQEVLKTHIDPATGIRLPIPEESPIMHGGAMIEFLLRQNQLRPVLHIAPRTALQAVAAAIFAERVQGATYRKCGWCGELFKIGSAGKKGRYKERLFCYSIRCKNNAIKRQTRQKARERKEQQQVYGNRPKMTAKRSRQS